MGRVPTRWLPYSCLGQQIKGTRFIAFKVPLKESICKTLNRRDWFTPAMLLEKCPRVSLVIDLTNTSRYYNFNDLIAQGVEYRKIFCAGGTIPDEKLVERFFEIVDNFLEKNRDPDSLIGVHCTHGLNRTSYFICSYMNRSLKIPAEEAISAFEDARGHKIERQEYVNALLRRQDIDNFRRPSTTRCNQGMEKRPSRSFMEFDANHKRSHHEHSQNIPVCRVTGHSQSEKSMRKESNEKRNVKKQKWNDLDAMSEPPKGYRNTSMKHSGQVTPKQGNSNSLPYRYLFNSWDVYDNDDEDQCSFESFSTYGTHFYDANDRKEFITQNETE